MLVHAIIEVPDDEVIDNRLPAVVSFLSSTSDGTLRKRSVEGDLQPLNQMLGQSLDINTMKVAEDEVIIFRYDSEVVAPEDAFLIKDILKSEFPNNKVLGLTSDVDFLIENADAAVDLLEKMIAHIKVMDGTQKKIVLT